MKKLFIFDLDGTLIDTIADLATSTNYALNRYQFPTHEPDAYPFFVGNGIKKLLERVLPEEEKTADNIQRIHLTFLEHYDAHNTDLSKPYDGIEQLLSFLHQQGFLLAVASNKYQEATDKLIAHYFPNIPFSIVLGQREGIPVKPHPAIVADILSHTHCLPEETVYIGDSGVDMQTAANSHIHSIGVTWGFRPRTELEAFGADQIVDTREELKGYLLSIIKR